MQVTTVTLQTRMLTQLPPQTPCSGPVCYLLPHIQPQWTLSVENLAEGVAHPLPQLQADMRGRGAGGLKLQMPGWSLHSLISIPRYTRSCHKSPWQPLPLASKTSSPTFLADLHLPEKGISEEETWRSHAGLLCHSFSGGRASQAVTF